jgi:acetoacetyl-CoA synthetase
MTHAVDVPQWRPTDSDIANARVTDFAKFVQNRTGATLSDYQSLWQWSVDDPSAFWGALWEYFGLGDPPDRVLDSSNMPGARWFPGVRLNYVDQIVRNARTDRPAILHVSEDGGVSELSWRELLGRVAAFAQTLRSHGVQAGDRVVGYLPNIPEAVIAFIATASIGAVWSACGQDYSAKAALDRLGQLEPVVLVTADGYRYGGKDHDKRDDVAALQAGLPTLRATLLASELTAQNDTELETVAVDFDHPLWILFSSGTTGLPKGIMHGHGGVVLEHLKALALQSDIGADDTFFWYTSPSWMMWNFQVAGLLVGATIVCYEGSPNHPKPDALWDIAACRRCGPSESPGRRYRRRRRCGSVTTSVTECRWPRSAAAPTSCRRSSAECAPCLCGLASCPPRTWAWRSTRGMNRASPCAARSANS